MTVSSVGDTSRTYAADSSTSTFAQVSEKSQEQFMMILLAQLKNQNPLEPLKDNELMAQMTQLNSLHELQAISAKIEQLAGSSSAGYAASLIGKQVKAHLSDGSDVEGIATGMTMKQGLYLINIGEHEVPMSAILQVSTPPAPAAATTSGTTGTNGVEVPAPESPANV
jgi:flagellar basal-body rod modification protein FlgD